MFDARTQLPQNDEPVNLQDSLDGTAFTSTFRSWCDQYMSKYARRIVIGVVGTTVIFLGIAMLILPGPGWVTIYLGFALLASEFLWARRLLRRANKQFFKLIPEKYRDRVRGWFPSRKRKTVASATKAFRAE